MVLIVFCFYRAIFSWVNKIRDKDKMKNEAYEILDEVQENLKFLASSGVRSKIMLSLKEGPKNLSELREGIVLRSSTILHGTNELEKRHMVYKKGDHYILSSTGKILTSKLIDMVKSVAVTKRFEKLWNGHQIEGIPEDLILEIGSLINSSLIESETTDITRTHSNFIEILSYSKKFSGVSPFFHPEFPNLLVALVSKGVETQLIVTKSIMNKLYELAAQDPETFTKISSQENFELWLIEEDVKFALTVNDKVISFGLVLDNGTYDYSMDLVSEDRDAILWGEKLFEYYLKKSKKIV